MATRIRHGRTQIDRNGITALTGAAGSTIAYWQRHRHRTGFPHKADTDQHGRHWYWRDEINTFWTCYQRRRARSYTEVDREGHPDDLLTAPEAAKVLGYKDHRSLTPALRDHPDHIERLPSGLLRRYWYRRTIWTYADTRHQRTSTGRLPGAVGPRQLHPYANDPRLPAAIALLAEAEAAGHSTRGLGAALADRLHIGARTAQRILAAARVIRQCRKCPTTRTDKRRNRRPVSACRHPHTCRPEAQPVVVRQAASAARSTISEPHVIA